MQNRNAPTQKYRTYKTILWWGIGGSIVAHVAFWGLLLSETVPPPLAIPGLFGTFVLAFGGAFGIAFVNRRLWVAMGQEVGLTPSENGLDRAGLSHPDNSFISKPILTGTVRGRPVRARVFTIKSSGEDSSSSTYMLVEADLEAPVEEGALVARGDVSLNVNIPNSNSGTQPGQPSMGERFEGLTLIEEGPFYGQTNAEALMQRVLSGRTRNDLEAVESFGLLHAGNSEAVYKALFSSFLSKVRDSIPEVGGFSLGSFLPSADEIANRMDYSDAQTVALQLEDTLYDPDELDRQVTAVAAVAEAFERAGATSDTESVR